MTALENTGTMLEYYAQSGPMTDPGEYLPLLAELPKDLPGLVRTVQGLMLHVFWADRYGQPLTEARQSEVMLRPVQAMLARLLEIDPRPLSEARPLEHRLVGNCRHFSLLLAAALKAHGVPARARCGFGTYFMPDHFEDHWMTEYWHTGESRWVRVDAQLDAFQQKELGIDFDPLDMPAGRFVVGGAAWRMCRQHAADPDNFGIFDMRGWDFIKNDLLLDVRALNNIELLPWDICGLAAVPYQELSDAQLSLLDRAAALSEQAGVETFAELRAFYAAEEGLQVPNTFLG